MLKIKLFMIIWLLLAPQLFAGGVTGGSGGIASFRFGIDLSQFGFGCIQFQVSIDDIGILRDAILQGEAVYSLDLEKEVVPFKLVITSRGTIIVTAETEDGKLVQFIKLAGP